MTFAQLAIGDTFRLPRGSRTLKKIETDPCPQAAEFYAGKVPGYPSVAPFYGWNAIDVTGCPTFAPLGGWSLAPDQEVFPDDQARACQLCHKPMGRECGSVHYDCASAEQARADMAPGLPID